MTATGIGPQSITVTLPTCAGCPAFTTKPVGLVTYAWCGAAGADNPALLETRLITAAWGATTPPPAWCPATL